MVSLRHSATCSAIAAPNLYVPRQPEDSVLYQAVSWNLETFLTNRRNEGRGVPDFVEREFRAYLECGIAAHGFLRLRCPACGAERLLPFSCKTRGFCPSCCGRRMADTAAYLVDRVFPRVPVRQWVLSMPHRIRYRLAFDPELLTGVYQVFARAVFGELRRRAQAQGAAGGRGGAVSWIQRFGNSLNLHVHIHMLALDGVYVDGGENASPRFVPLDPPADADVERLTETLSCRIPAFLARRTTGVDVDAGDDP